MVCLCKRIPLAFLFTVVSFSFYPLTSYTQECKFQAAVLGKPAMCVAVSSTGECSPVITGTGSTGTCKLLPEGEECTCVGSSASVLTTITVTPNPRTLLLGATQKFSATGHDANGKLMLIVPTWSVVANGGSIDSSGLFIAGRVAGTFTNTVMATSGGISGYATVAVTTDTVPLTGFVDLHTHPLSNLAFGGKLLYGGTDFAVDGGALLPADPDCNLLRGHYVRATSEQQALGHDKSTHGGYDFVSNPCGDEIRKSVIHEFQTALGGADESEDASGSPDFPEWPVWNDLTHQKMWVEWIRRAHTGGLSVMVALAVNNKTLGDMVKGAYDLLPTDDKSSADFQIAEIKSFVGRHADFMEIAYTSADLYRIISAKKLAVVIGVEVDHIGNLPAVPAYADVKTEIDRLYYEEGVRYIFPIHVIDSAFGGSAAYENLFNVSNLREDGHAYALVCAKLDEKNDNGININKDITYTYNNNALSFEFAVAQLLKLEIPITSIPSPTCYLPGLPVVGQKNSLALTPSGQVAIKEMMRLGMLIDIDHMSQAAADATLAIATQFGYPMNSGHNGVRGTLSTNHNERALRADQYTTIGTLHGMAGVGSGGLNAQMWLWLYNQVIAAMAGNGGGSFVGGFGTDTNGFALGMPPRLGSEEPGGPDYPKYMQCIKDFICGDGISRLHVITMPTKAAANNFRTPSLRCRVLTSHTPWLSR
jgi:microsomal dipeptidase-like Zn-dependent dipeptidase